MIQGTNLSARLQEIESCPVVGSFAILAAIAALTIWASKPPREHESAGKAEGARTPQAAARAGGPSAGRQA